MQSWIIIFRQKDLNQSYLLYIDTYMYIYTITKVFYLYLNIYIVNTMYVYYIYKLLSNLHYVSVDKVEANQPLYVI